MKQPGSTTVSLQTSPLIHLYCIITLENLALNVSNSTLVTVCEEIDGEPSMIKILTYKWVIQGVQRLFRWIAVIWWHVYCKKLNTLIRNKWMNKKKEQISHFSIWKITFDWVKRACIPSPKITKTQQHWVLGFPTQFHWPLVSYVWNDFS